jgi:hypothetical protein
MKDPFNPVNMSDTAKRLEGARRELRAYSDRMHQCRIFIKDNYEIDSLGVDKPIALKFGFSPLSDNIFPNILWSRSERNQRSSNLFVAKTATNGDFIKKVGQVVATYMEMEEKIYTELRPRIQRLQTRLDKKIRDGKSV